MSDPSFSDISNDTMSLATANEGEIWNSLSPETRSIILGQIVGTETNISNNTKNVYQRDLKNSSYETMSYYSLPPSAQFHVSNRLHEMGYFRETYGGNVYEVEGDDRYQCKDCEETFTAEEDFRVHRKINHENEESETESREAYSRSLYIDPDITKDNLSWARQVLRGESARQTFPQNDAPTVSEPKLPKGKKGYDDNPNHYFYDNKLFKKGTRTPYEQEGRPASEASLLIDLESEILNKYGWESTKDVEKSQTNRDIYASEIAKKVFAGELHPRTLRILDSVNKPLLFKTLLKLGARETQPEEWDEQVRKEEPKHPDYDPEHPHEHNDFDKYFGDKVAEEEIVPNLLKEVDISMVEVESEDYNIDEKEDKKATEARTLSSYVGNKTKGGESLADIMEGAIDVPVERETVEETIYNRKLNGYHEDKIARELWINHGLEYEDAIQQIRGVEVSDDDRVAITLFGKKLHECNQAEISEMRIYAGEAKKNTTGVRYD